MSCIIVWNTFPSKLPKSLTVFKSHLNNFVISSNENMSSSPLLNNSYLEAIVFKCVISFIWISSFWSKNDANGSIIYLIFLQTMDSLKISWNERNCKNDISIIYFLWVKKLMKSILHGTIGALFLVKLIYSSKSNGCILEI